MSVEMRFRHRRALRLARFWARRVRVQHRIQGGDWRDAPLHVDVILQGGPR